MHGSLPTILLLALGLLVAMPASAEAILLTGARVLDPAGDRWLEDQSVFVAGGRISRIGPEERMRLVDDVRVIDLEGLYLLPGLIDLHSHLLLHPYDETSWNDQVLRESLELRTVRGVASAEATLRAGFTTLRDLGTEGAAFADVALRDAIEQGIVPGPRVLASTRAIVAVASYGPSGFDPRWKLPKGAQEANGVAGVRQAVREQVAAGTPEPDRIRESRETFQRALAVGVTIATGSDVGVFRHGDNAREIELMVAYGMPAVEALRATTSVAASVIDRGTDLGRVAEGFVADLIAVVGDPLELPESLRDPVFVMKEGLVVHAGIELAHQRAK